MEQCGDGMGGKVWDSFFFFNISYYPYCWIGWETLGGKPWWKHVKIHTANDLLFFFPPLGGYISQSAPNHAQSEFIVRFGHIIYIFLSLR